MELYLCILYASGIDLFLLPILWSITVSSWQLLSLYGLFPSFLGYGIWRFTSLVSTRTCYWTISCAQSTFLHLFYLSYTGHAVLFEFKENRFKTKKMKFPVSKTAHMQCHNNEMHAQQSLIFTLACYAVAGPNG